MPSQLPPSSPPDQGLDFDSLKALLQEASPARVVVATDWSRAATAFVITQAFADAFTADAPAELVIAVRHEPTADDVDCVRVLVEEIETDRDVPPVKIESFQEAVGQPYDVSVVPLGDRDTLMQEVAAAITRMHRIAGGAVSPEDRNRANIPALARRLSAYTEA